ncbi:hypothetical protein [Paracraurococcus lichenis]|uniref:Uncharacterized protein n=1 Tax=Paracraurococcus lichenis TaxID=3064888 RepID=A0ABT9DUY8_9PROT|nr:hypothetical protein [Paracraurococcus sp. LOR1-02]MDO9707714.1 hypothetical protein [Paracraurococcus sp. LOR1-02]
MPDIVQLALWGGGPSGEDLDIVVADPKVGRVQFPGELAGFPVSNLRVFEFIGTGAGQTEILAKVPRTGASYAMPITASVGGVSTYTNPPVSFHKFYHGTNLASAKKLMCIDLTPMTVPEALLLDVNEYTDFGKGFYTHPEEGKRKAIEWAKRRNHEWGVVRFSLTSKEYNTILGKALFFPDKYKTRPGNAPKLFHGQNSTWIEFVEFNRHVRLVDIKRPKDNDWTADYCWMRGPIWGRADSGLPGAPGLPEKYHQVNWGLSGMQALNTPDAKRRRFLFTKHNEHML